MRLINAEVKPDFASAMSVQTECRTWKLVFESYAEVKPDFANAKIQSEAPLHQFFSSSNIAPRKFSTPRNGHSALYLRAFRRIFHSQKKWNRDITFYLMPISKTYEASSFCLSQMLRTNAFLLLSRTIAAPVFCMRHIDSFWLETLSKQNPRFFPTP